ncbi:heavy metal translocating P-type ATPase [Edaphobacter aggregans]|uniref:heavy metal translocating P-type ATPase n=1 Tax=Edaphobacter aggregans TaxID=570835 RepID=UPI00068D9326|nr:heavy metal translocating P-type ATPase [Edaphobacter aggregans]
MNGTTTVRLKESPSGSARRIWNSISVALSLTAIVLYLLFHYVLQIKSGLATLPLWAAIIAGGLPLLYDLFRQVLKRQFGSDFLAGLSIVTATIMGELLVATIIVLMLSGGQTLETFATKRASSVLDALAHRMPNIAHRIVDGTTHDIAVADIRTGDRLIVLPHEICPVDGTVESGTGTMDESFLTGEPFRIRKISGSQVISGALNEDFALTILADKLAIDSRYERIMRVIETAEQHPPRIRRLADRLGAVYTPVAIVIALMGWLLSGDPDRFLAVIVIATPCPLLLAIPISIIGAISLSAKRGIVIKRPVVLEQIGGIQAMFFDKTGTLTHGEPIVTDTLCFSGATSTDVLRLAASLEQYSKHPLASAILHAAEEQKIDLQTVEDISEKPGEGLSGHVAGRKVLVAGRRKLAPEIAKLLPASTSGMECVVLSDGQLVGLFKFHDRPRKEGQPFIRHLKPKHHINHLMILSGDRDSEVQHLAHIVGITDVRANLTPEDKLKIVRNETEKAPTLFLGDGINDAPAMMAATVGVAFGQNSDITAEAAGAVILEPTLGKVDEFLHIGNRMRRIALQSAIGGMVLSSVGMMAAAFGLLPPLAGAIGQEIIDLLAVLNAVRTSIPTKELRDF